ncbi:hypothetical protein ASZ78_014762 [Callipepla squamata]|uniref:Phospholipid scramblase n=1 Tax=Callipepla squamata TaxID=9009 RepID=A0A226N919_CALSU|nr:hypothetical protein ASZ78_014762 [Callipepla squamata]
MASQEFQGQTNPVFKDYLPGSSDLPEQDKPAETAGPWKQTSHTHNLPPGLEYLNQLDRIIIHQQVELLEGMVQPLLGSNSAGTQLSPTGFQTQLLADLASGFQHGVSMLEVQSPPGTVAGYVVQNWDPFLPKFTIQNESKEDVLKIIGPCATCGCFEDVDFEVKALNEMSTIGKISKYWSGFVNNVFTNTANFGIQVPVDLDVKIKAVMIGACFLIVTNNPAPAPGFSDTGYAPGNQAPYGHPQYAAGNFYGAPGAGPYAYQAQPMGNPYGAAVPPVQNQPPGTIWMPIPPPLPNCPPGLEYLTQIEVQAPPGTPVGYVVQNWHPCLPKFTIQDEKRMDVLKISGPCVVCSCCEDVNFEVKSLDEVSNVGRISKQWSGFLKEAFTDTDNFGVSFPMDLDVRMKAVMLGACFLIDFMFFESIGDSHQRSGVWQ